MKFKPAGIAFCIGCESFQSAKTVQALLVVSYLAVPNIVSSPTETGSPSLGYVIFTPKLDIFRYLGNSKGSWNKNEHDCEASNHYGIFGCIEVKSSKSQHFRDTQIQHLMYCQSI